MCDLRVIEGNPSGEENPSFSEGSGRKQSDEIAVAKGHRYVSIILDLTSEGVVFVGEGKGADALHPFWKRLKRAKANIRAVAMDRSPAYIDALTTHLPNARIVFDHFHVIKLFSVLWFS